MKPMLGVIMALFLALYPTQIAAHENMPLVVSLRELRAGTFTLGLRAAGNIEESRRPGLSLPPPCTIKAQGPNAMLYQCPIGTPPRHITLNWTSEAPPSALVFRSQFIGQAERVITEAPGATSLRIQPRETFGGVILSYLALGTAHIWGGMDHMLFLLCLVLIARGFKRICLTVTGFTLGHALTISLASLQLVRVNGAVTEALIALSIVFAAAELVRGRQDTLFRRFPALVAAGFGTLHGLGFAGALAKIGLAQSYLITSLIGFNLGVELGQIAIVLLIYLGMRIAPKVQLSRARLNPPKLRMAALYFIGSVAGYWFWARGLAII